MVDSFAATMARWLSFKCRRFRFLLITRTSGSPCVTVLGVEARSEGVITVITPPCSRRRAHLYRGALRACLYRLDVGSAQDLAGGDAALDFGAHF